MASLRVSRSLNALLLVIAWASVLSLAREVLIPIAFAVLLSFLLSPLVAGLEKRRVPRGVAVILVITLAFSALGLTSWIVLEQFVALGRDLPQYAQNVRSKFQEVKGPLGSATHALHRMNEQLRALGRTTPKRADKAVQVEVVASAPDPMDLLRRALFPLLNPAATIGLVLIFTFFILLEARSLGDRLAQLGQVTRTTSVFDEAAKRVSRYLLMQLLVNVVFGLSAAAGLKWIGLPNALLWGLVAVPLRFVPYIGGWIAAGAPALLALAYFNDWFRPLEVLALFVVLEIAVSQFLEPIIYGTSAGLHPFAILLSAVFWTWLWGGVGLLMATPLTVCVAVLGRHVPQLGFLHVLLSDEPVLERPARFYQRLLVGNMFEVRRLAEEETELEGTNSFFDNLALPALNLALRERREGLLDRAGLRIVVKSMDALLREFEERLPPVTGPSVCCAVVDGASGLAARMLRILLSERAIALETVRARRTDRRQISLFLRRCSLFLFPFVMGRRAHALLKAASRHRSLIVLAPKGLSSAYPGVARIVHSMEECASAVYELQGASMAPLIASTAPQSMHESTH